MGSHGTIRVWPRSRIQSANISPSRRAQLPYREFKDERRSGFCHYERAGIFCVRRLLFGKPVSNPIVDESQFTSAALLYHSQSEAPSRLRDRKLLGRNK